MKLAKLLTKPIAAAKWVKSLDLASKKKWEEANLCLESMEKYIDGQNIEFYLLLGLVKYALGDDSASSKSFIKAEKLLEGTNKYNTDEKKYLMSYARMFQNCDNNLLDLESSNTVDISNINLLNVSSALKANFPIKDN